MVRRWLPGLRTQATDQIGRRLDARPQFRQTASGLERLGPFGSLFIEEREEQPASAGAGTDDLKNFSTEKLQDLLKNALSKEIP